MYLVKRTLKPRIIKALVRYYSKTRNNHYDVLKVRRNCSDREIKDAFIQMSKEYHPDKNKDANAQARFVQIVEAYNVLGKPSSRAQYDTLQTSPLASTVSPHAYNPHHNMGHSWRKPQYNYYREPPRESESKQTAQAQAASALKNIPKYVIALICLGFALLGGLMQVILVGHSYRQRRRLQQETTIRNAEQLELVRAAAERNGNREQTRLLLEKIVTSSNPTVATATLGHALADEKK